MVHVSSNVIGVTDIRGPHPFYEQVPGVKFDEFRPSLVLELASQMRECVEVIISDEGGALFVMEQKL